MMRKEFRKYTLLLSLVIFTSCEDMIEVDRPVTRLISDSVFEDDLTATAAISGLYESISSSFGSGDITYMTSLSSDELILEQGDTHLQFYENQIQSTNADVQTIWTSPYRVIFESNVGIEGLQNASKLSPGLRLQLLGEALFIRAFCHFYLVNLFGDIPYITTSDYRVNGSVTRDPSTEVYENIIADLLEAKSLLADDYSYSDNARVRTNKWVATALLARTYLYTGQWTLAEQQATTVINETSLFGLNTDLNAVFLKNSKESIWQLVPPRNQLYVSEGGIFNRGGYDPSVAALSDELVNAFETGDARETNWIGFGDSGGTTRYYPLKYKETFATGSGAEYYTVFRLSEQYLIRAEARAMQNKLIRPDGAESDINAIRNRAGLSNTSATTQSELLSAIELERRVELFVEWGHRWFDLKRTGKADAILGALKSGWNGTDVLYPIPFEELQLNPNLTQNPGY